MMLSSDYSLFLSHRFPIISFLIFMRNSLSVCCFLSLYETSHSLHQYYPLVFYVVLSVTKVHADLCHCSKRSGFKLGR